MIGQRLAVTTTTAQGCCGAEHTLQHERDEHTDPGLRVPPRSSSRPWWTDLTCPDRRQADPVTVPPQTWSPEPCLRPQGELASLLSAPPGPERRSILWRVITVSSPSRRTALQAAAAGRAEVSGRRRGQTTCQPFQTNEHLHLPLPLCCRFFHVLAALV